MTKPKLFVATMALFLAGCASNATCDSSCAANEERYHACVATSDEAACKSAGGSWIADFRYGDASAYLCSCATGQEGRTCGAKADCLSGCSNTTKTVGPTDSCDGVPLTCEPSNLPMRGCHCRYWYAGKVEPVCLD